MLSYFQLYFYDLMKQLRSRQNAIVANSKNRFGRLNCIEKGYLVVVPVGILPLSKKSGIITFSRYGIDNKVRIIGQVSGAKYPGATPVYTILNTVSYIEGKFEFNQ